MVMCVTTSAFYCGQVLHQLMENSISHLKFVCRRKMMNTVPEIVYIHPLKIMNLSP